MKKTWRTPKVTKLEIKSYTTGGTKKITMKIKEIHNATQKKMPAQLTRHSIVHNTNFDSLNTPTKQSLKS